MLVQFCEHNAKSEQLNSVGPLHFTNARKWFFYLTFRLKLVHFPSAAHQCQTGTVEKVVFHLVFSGEDLCLATKGKRWHSLQNGGTLWKGVRAVMQIGSKGKESCSHSSKKNKKTNPKHCRLHVFITENSGGIDKPPHDEHTGLRPQITHIKCVRSIRIN